MFWMTAGQSRKKWDDKPTIKLKKPRARTVGQTGALFWCTISLTNFTRRVHKTSRNEFLL
jgi:hypothetical protein